MKQDPKQVALKQTYEIYYISGKYEIPVKDVRAAVKEVGKSRKKVYAKLREMGYVIKIKDIK